MSSFKKSEFNTIGVELELQLINKTTFNLVNGIQSILAHKDIQSLPCIIKPEITKNNLEINSSVHQSVHALHDELLNMRNELNHILMQTEYAVCGGGTHPFQDWKNSEIYPSDHYRLVEKKYGYLAKHDTIFGMHIHIGCRTGEEAIYLCHALSMYVPHLIALSASSPFFREVDTSYQSSRTNISSSFPTTGHISPFQTWEKFLEYVELLKTHQVIEAVNDFYWDIRPQTKFGTVEIRIFDMPLTIEKVCMIVAFVKALSQYLIVEKIPMPLNELYIFYNYNKYQSARYGFNAIYIDPLTNEHFNLKNHLLITLYQIKEIIDDPFYALLKSQIMLENNDAKWLRDIFQEQNCFKKLVDNQINIWSS